MKNWKNKFCIFIMSHGRAEKVITYKTLQKSGYTGKVYIVCDNEDEQLDAYKKKYGDKVLVFDKRKTAERIDTGTNDNSDRRAIVYARNECFDFAEKLGYEYFLELDDDYSNFQYRYTLAISASAKIQFSFEIWEV